MRKLKLFFACLLMAVLSVGQVWGATTTYQHIFNAKPSTGDNVELSSVNWNITASSLGSYNSSNYAGVQLGTSKANGSITLTSSSGWGGETGTYKDKTVITEVRLWLNLGGTSVTPTVTIGGKAATSDGTPVVKNSSAGSDYTKATKVTFTPASDGKTGVVVINVATVKAGYICAMEIDCEEAGGDDPGDDPGEDPVEPTISTDPVDANYVVGASATALTVEATASAGDLHYQWYSNTTESTEGASTVGTDAASYTPSTTSAGTTYYYCVVTDDNGSATSGFAAVKVSEPTGTFALFSGALTEGDYVIYYSGKALKNTITSSRFDYLEVTPANDKLTNPDEAIIWHIAASGDYWTIYNAAVEKYAAGTGTKNQGGLLDSGSDDKSLWTVSGSSTYEFVNKKNTASSVNANLRNNGTSGFACYSTQTGGALTLYKKQLPAHELTFGVASSGHGTLTASVGGSAINSGAQVAEGATVTLTPTADTYYQVSAVEVLDGNADAVTTTENDGVYTFAMPASVAVAEVSFAYIPVTGLTLNKSALDLLVDAEETLSVTAVAPADAYNGVNWSSSATGIATVDADGKVTAKAEGTATITATSVVTGTVTATCAVTVTAPSGHEIGITSANGTVVATSDDEVIDIADVLKDVAVVLTATPNDGYTISGWTVVGLDEGDYSISQDKTTCSFTMPDDEVLVEVTYTHEVAVLKLHDANGVTDFAGDHFWKEEVTLPTSAAACSKTFVGWSVESDHSSAPELGATYVLPNKGENHIYAVYATANGGDTDVEFNAGTYASANNWSNGEAYLSATKDDVTFTVSGGGNNGKYYTSDKSWRFYSGGSLSISSSDGDITAVSSTPSVEFTIENGSASYSFGTTVKITAITVTVEGEATYSNYSTTCQQQAAAPTFSVEAGTYYVAQNNIVLSSTTESATIYYTTDGSDPKTSGTKQTYSGAISLSERAITTIKAYAVAEGYESSAVAEAIYNINLPYDFADFAALTKENGKEYVVRGIISQKDAFNTQYNEIPYYISANGSTEGQIKCHNGLGLNKAPFTSADDINLGDNVTVVGSWSTQYTNLGAGNWMLEYTARVHDSYSIEGSLTASSFDDGDAFSNAILANLTVKETFTNGYYENVAGVTFNAGEKTAWADGDTKLTVNAVLNEKTIATKDFDVTVSSAQLASIALKADDENYSTKVVYYLGETFVAPTIIATLDDESTFPAEATLVSGFDNTDAEKVGTQEVTVSYTRGEVTKTTKYNITMKAVVNNDADPHSVADALYLIGEFYSASTSSDSMVVAGIVSRLDGTYDNTYWISDNGDAENELEVYSGKYFAGATFTAENRLHVGDQVVVKGKVKTYKGTKEFDSGSRLISALRAGALTVADVAALEIGQELAEADLTINRNGSTGAITFSCEENDALEIVDNKLQAKGEAVADVTVTATMAEDNTVGAINFTSATTTFNVHVVLPQVRYAVTFNMDGGSAAPSLDTQLEGANVIIPAGTYTKDGYKFNGWAVTYVDANEQVQEVTVTKTGDVYSFTMPAAAVTVTAQWVEGMDVTWVVSTWASANGINSNTNLTGEYATIAVDANISMTWDPKTGNTPAYNSSNNDVRLYRYNSVTFESTNGKLLKGITLNFRTSSVKGSDMAADCGTYNAETGVWSGLSHSVTITNTGTANVQANMTSISFTYINGTETTLDIENVSLKLSEGTKALSISCNVDPVPAISYEIAEADQEIATIENGVVTAHAVGGPINVTARIAQGSNYTAAVANFTITVTDKTQPVMSFPQASYDANLGSPFTAPVLTTNPEGIAVTYSSSETSVATVSNEEGHKGEITLVGEGTTVITAAFAGDEDYSANSASYTLNVTDPNKDVLTAELIGQSGYGSWNDKTFGSGVKYAGHNTTGSGNTIQMNANPGGIVSTSAIGYLKELRATAGSSNAKKLHVYAKNTAYESSADLYDAEKRGEQIGTIAANGGVLVFDGTKSYADNYKYIGIKSEGGAVYYDDITIKWTPAEFAKYTVTYQAGEGSGDDIVVKNVEEGTNISLAENTFTAPENTVFAGWKLNGEGNPLEAGSSYTVNANVRFVAQWTPIYTVTYQAGEGTGEDVVVENIEEGTNISLAENTFTAPENTVFAGWKNGNDVYQAGAEYTVNASVTFVAQWTPIYTVTYQAGAGEGTDVVRNNVPAGDYTLEDKPEGFSKDLDAFRGWKLNGEGDLLAAGSTYTLNANAIFVAVWEAPTTCVLTLSRNGVTEVLAEPIAQAQAFDLSDYTADNTAGYTFAGWTDEPIEGDVADIVPFFSYTPAVGVTTKTLYAVYSRTDESVGSGKYEKATEIASGAYLIVCGNQNVALDGSLTTLDVSRNTKAVSITDGVLTLENAENYVFTIAAKDGGYSIKSASGKYIGHTGNSNALKTSDTDAYTNTISISDGNATVTCNNSYKLQYNSQSGQERFRYFSGTQTAIQLYKEKMGQTVYATSPVEKITITFNANYGQGGCQNATINKGSEFTICAEIPTKDKTVVFAGWKNGDDVYEAGNTYTFNESMTLTAQWDPARTYTVTYDVNGGSGEVPDQAVNYAGDKFTIANGVTKSGYTFKGWKYNGKLYKAGNQFTMPAANVTFEANWKKMNISTDNMRLVTDAGMLADGMEFALGSSYNNTFAMAGDIQSGKTFMSAVTSGVSISAGIATFTDDVLKLVAEQVAGGWKIRKDATNYLTITGSDVMWGTQANATVWSININDSNVYIANGSNTILYNHTSPRFKTYSGTGDYVTSIQLFSKATVVTADANVSDLGYVEEDEVIIVPSGTTLTIDEPEAPSFIAQAGSTVKVTGDVTNDENNPVQGKSMIAEIGGEIVVEVETEVNEEFSVKAVKGQGSTDNATTSSAISISDPENVHVHVKSPGHFDFTLAVSGEAAANQWHDFSVPFPVHALNGVYGYKDGEWKKLTNEVDYAIMDHHGDIRANGGYEWKKFRGVMQPGKIYSLTVNGDIETFRFMKTADNYTLQSETVSYAANTSANPGDNNGGWNGLGTIMLNGASVSANGGTFAAIYVLVNTQNGYSGTNGSAYRVVAPSEINLMIGSAFIVQVSGAGTINFGGMNAGAINYAPARNAAEQFGSVKVTLSDGSYTDNLYLSASEDALNQYEIGKDLVKKLISNTPVVPTLYTTNYNGTKLAVEYAPLNGESVDYALTLYAPKAGEYTVAATQIDGATVYLTKNGQIIWNLSSDDYVTDLAKGSDSSYGIRIVKAPNAATGTENIEAAEAGAQKVIIDNHVYILRNEQMYDVTGKAVK